MSSPDADSNQTLHERVLAVAALLVSLDMSVMDFVFALFWGDADCRSDERLKRARITFNSDPRLPQLLRNLHRPPRTGGTGKRPAAARSQLEGFAFSCVMGIFKRELEAYEKTTFVDSETLDLAYLKTITLNGVFDDLVQHAPRLFASMKELMQTYNQQRRNTRKAPDTLAAVAINIIVFSRSQKQGVLQKFLSMFFKAEGLPVRSFDVLNAFGLSMSRAWVDRMVTQFAEKSMSEVRDVVLNKAVCIPSDNLRFNAHVDSQRLDNVSIGVNCTGMTVVQLPDRFADVLQNFSAHSLKRDVDAQGKPRVIGWSDMVDLDALNQVHKFSSHLVLSALFDLSDLADHPLRSHERLQRPEPVSALPSGASHRTRMWALGTADIDQASYEGSALVLDEILRQLGLNTLEQQQRLACSGIPLAGDLLTCQRFKGLKGLLCEDDNGFDRLDFAQPVHGYFHNVMNLQYAAFENHRGNSAGDGFAREINVLKRTGLSASTKHPNVHTLDEFLSHFWAAATLDNWMWASGTDTIAQLVQWALAVDDAEEFLRLAQKIVRERQSSAALTLLEEQITSEIQLASRASGSSSQPSRAKAKADRKAFSDARLASRIVCSRDLLLMQVERFAIKHGDVGLLDTLNPLLAIFFKGGGHGNYGNDLLDYLQWRKYESTPELRDLVRNCWLVNTKGHEDSFLPVDQMQEHFNRQQREWHTRVGANFSFDLLKRISPAIPALAEIIDHVAANFDLPYRSHVHKSPDAQRDIRIMAQRFHGRKTSEYCPGREIRDAVNQPKDYMASGTILLQKPSTWDKVFGDRMMYLENRSTAQDFESAEDVLLVDRFRRLHVAEPLVSS